MATFTFVTTDFNGTRKGASVEQEQFNAVELLRSRQDVYEVYWESDETNSGMILSRDQVNPDYL